jgi:hypothetical protein
MITKLTAGSGGREMTASAGDSQQTPQSPNTASSSGQAQRSPTNLDNRMVMLLIGARIAANILRSPRFYQALIVAAIGSVAAARIGQEGQASALGRIGAWDAKQLQRFKHQQERRAGRVARKAERQVRRLERKTKIPIT